MSEKALHILLTSPGIAHFTSTDTHSKSVHSMQCLMGLRELDWTFGQLWAPWTERHLLKVSLYIAT